MAPCKMPRSVPASFSTAIILAAVVWRTAGAVNIPDNLTTEDLSTYTIRYLSTDGRDTEACLSSAQDIQVNSSTSIPSDTIQYCGSLLYALTGGNTSLFENDGNNARRIMVLVTPGVHLIGEGGIILSHYQSIILSKTPDASGEVVFKCNGFLEAGYNNLYFFYTRNVILNEIVFTECGSFISPVNIQLAANVTVSKCVFR